MQTSAHSKTQSGVSEVIIRAKRKQEIAEILERYRQYQLEQCGGCQLVIKEMKY